MSDLFWFTLFNIGLSILYVLCVRQSNKNTNKELGDFYKSSNAGIFVICFICWIVEILYLIRPNQ